MQSQGQVVEVKQSPEPVLIDEIVEGSVQRVENTVIAISAVTGLVLILARFGKPEVKQEEAPASPSPSKKGPGRPPKSAPAVANNLPSAEQTMQ